MTTPSLLKKMTLALALTMSAFTAQANTQGDYDDLVNTIILGASLTKTDISCDDFITNFKEFAAASTEMMMFQMDAGELELRDAANEVKAKTTLDAEAIFTNLGMKMAPNLEKCEHRLMEIAHLIN